MNDASSPPLATIKDKLYFSGINSPDRKSNITEQTRNVLRQLDTLLAQAGTNRSALLTVHIWLRDMALFREMTAVWNDWIGTEAPPSRSCVSGGSLNPDALIEIVATAASPASVQDEKSIERFGLVRGPGRPTMCLGLAYHDWFTVCTLAPDCNEDIAGQTGQVLQIFDNFLAEAGTDRSKILTMDIWLRRMSDKAVVEQTLATWLTPDHLPSGSCVRADMASPEMLIEIRITALR